VQTNTAICGFLAAAVSRDIYVRVKRKGKLKVRVKVKVKVKFALEQATTAQRGSRSLALLFL
jgi:hypothetical protein